MSDGTSSCIWYDCVKQRMQRPSCLMSKINFEEYNVVAKQSELLNHKYMYTTSTTLNGWG